MNSLRNLIADVLWDGSDPDALEFADAILADPRVAAIIDLAAWATDNDPDGAPEKSPEVRALLADWRAKS